eukprot:886114-Amphidinium_carterae.1
MASGRSWKVGVDWSWSIVDVKYKLEDLSGVHHWEQQFLVGSGDPLQNSATLRQLCETAGSTPQITMVRQERLVGEWLEKIHADWRSLARAPPQIRQHAYVVQEAMRLCQDAVQYADPELASDAGFLLHMLRTINIDLLAVEDRVVLAQRVLNAHCSLGSEFETLLWKVLARIPQNAMQETFIRDDDLKLGLAMLAHQSDPI